MKKEAVSVRRNMAKEVTHDDSKTSESPSLLVPVPGLDHVPNTASVVFKSSLEKAIEEECEDDDDVFSDALDTLSLKHSISGGLEATKPPVASENPDQSRDFMLNRFLPAAKSMTMEQQQPQYAMKRQPSPFMSEPVRQIRDIVAAATPKRYEYNTTPYYQDIYDDDTSDEDEDEASEYLSRRGCGMSPQLCLGMLTSVHGLKEKPYSLRTTSHDQVKTSKVAQLKSRFQSVKKLALDKLGSRAQSPVHTSVGKKFGSEQVDTNLRSASVPSSPYRQTGCLSPYRSVGNCSPLHSTGFPGTTRKEAEIMRANRLNKHIKNPKKSQDLLYPKSTRLDCSTSSVTDKTLHVDTEKNPQTSNVKISPETTSEEPEMAVKKPKAVFKHQAVESLSIRSGINKIKADDLEKNNSGCDMSPLALPTPKKPSESWLLRNLPSVSSKISSRRYLFHTQKKDLKEDSTSVTKWETIVKTSCVHRDHIRYSEELVARSSCQSTT